MQFSGQLRANEIFSTIFNMIIGQQVFSSPIKHNFSKFLDESKREVGLYGDTMLYYSVDVLKSYEFMGDRDLNVLQLHRPKDPKCQSIVLDKFRQIPLTIDNYLSKRAWSTESAFSTFNQTMIKMMNDTRRIHETTVFNTYLGTTRTTVGRQDIKIQLPEEVEGNPEATNRLQAQTIATKMADLMVDLEDYSRDFNDYEYLRSLSTDDLVIIWNSEYLNKILKTDLPTIYHKDGVMEKTENRLPARYFGDINTEGGRTSGANVSIRSLIEKDYGATHVFPGDLLPNDTDYLENETYTENSKIIAKVMHKNSVPFLTSLSVNTTFVNPKALNENHYLTFGYNTLQKLDEYPFITIEVSAI